LDLDLEELKLELEERRAVLLSRLDIKGNNEEDPDLMEVENPDRADLAQDYFQQNRHDALRSRMEDTLKQVEGALERIDAGEYGKCKRCGNDISAARLQAIPFAEYCIECQEALEKNRTR
jgi:DnaK suppressor protein